ncbi:MAG: hypothetical protein J6X60_03535, partial [Ruminiclostridium sp.]|nr:hypothetical protein [Ruminiclostridium sp.]
VLGNDGIKLFISGSNGLCRLYHFGCDCHLISFFTGSGKLWDLCPGKLVLEKKQEDPLAYLSSRQSF